MKKILTAIAIGIAAFVAYTQLQNPTEDSAHFAWNEEQEYQLLEKVRFANGDFIQVAEGELQNYKLREECENKRLEVKRESTNSLLYVSGACDGIVHIRAAYPNPKNAKLAVVTTNCGGTACNTWNEHFIVFIGDSGIQVVKVGSSFYGPKNKRTQYEFNFSGQRLVGSMVRNFYDGTENDLGDLVSSTRTFIQQGAYVDLRFDKRFWEFVGEHPDTVLGDAQARAELIQKMKPERFRAFRTAMSGPGSSSVYNGRFLVMNACMKSNCPHEFGSVVLDGFTGALHVMRFNPDDNYFDYASTRKLNEDVDASWLEEIDTQQRYHLSIKSGRLQAIKNRS
jgi:hypothetical protein